MIVPVRDEYAPPVVHGDRTWIEELSRGAPDRSPLAEKLTVAVKHFHTMVEGVRHVHRARVVHRDSLGRVEEAVVDTQVPPLSLVSPIGIESLDPAVPRVGHVNGPIRRHGPPVDVAWLTTPRAVVSPLASEMA